MPTTRLSPQNFEMFSGNTKPVKFDVIDHNDAIVDLTGATGSLAIAKRPDVEATITKAGSVPGAPINRIEFLLDPADTEPLVGTFYYECKVTDASGRVSTIAFGNIYIRRNLL